MKKTFAIVCLAMLAAGASAQTNLQLFYDFGEGREHFTSTLEMFKSDNWGNTFFFVDYDYNFKMREPDGDSYVAAPNKTYFEIERVINFWRESALAPLGIQIEYDGGFGSTGLLGSYPITSAWLLGADFAIPCCDCSNSMNLKVLYRKTKKDSESIPVQFSAVWGMHRLFGLDGLSFSGYADFFGQENCWLNEDGTEDETDWVFLSEPQLWYNVGRHFGCDNFNIGGEIELGYNFGGNAEQGFKCNPCLGVKWNF